MFGRILNMPRAQNMPCSKYTKVLKMPSLQRVMPKFLNMPIYAWICLNMFNMLEFLKYLKTFTIKNIFDCTHFSVHYQRSDFFIYLFFSIWVFFHEHSQITGLQGKGEGISLTPHYHFHPLHRHLDISRAITAESSPLHIASSRTQTGNLWFPSASR